MGVVLLFRKNQLSGGAVVSEAPENDEPDKSCQGPGDRVSFGTQKSDQLR
jgi:hypothetical protein